MLKVLFLDDDPDRHIKFKRNVDGLPNSIIAYAFTYDQAISYLSAETWWDVVYLDNDLSREAAMGHPALGEKMGYHVAEYIVDLVGRYPERVPKMVVIHTLNFWYRTKMRDLLSKAGIPFRVEPFNKGLGKELWRGLQQNLEIAVKYAQEAKEEITKEIT